MTKTPATIQEPPCISAFYCSAPPHPGHRTPKPHGGVVFASKGPFNASCAAGGSSTLEAMALATEVTWSVLGGAKEHGEGFRYSDTRAPRTMRGFTCLDYLALWHYSNMDVRRTSLGTAFAFLNETHQPNHQASDVTPKAHLGQPRTSNHALRHPGLQLHHPMIAPIHHEDVVRSSGSYRIAGGQPCTVHLR